MRYPPNLFNLFSRVFFARTMKPSPQNLPPIVSEEQSPHQSPKVQQNISVNRNQTTLQTLDKLYIHHQLVKSLRSVQPKPNTQTQQNHIKLQVEKSQNPSKLEKGLELLNRYAALKLQKNHI